MSQSEPLVFSDKNIKPDNDLIFSIIGDKKVLWFELMDHMSKTFGDASGQWNWYNDGKQWLFKMVQKKKTIFWLAMHNDTFRVTFYFGDKAEPIIDSSDLPQTIKDAFRNGKRYGKIRAASLKIQDLADIESVKKLVAIKVKLK